MIVLLLFKTQAAGYWESETNATGHILKKQGIYVEMLDWLAIGLKYKYIRCVIVFKIVVLWMQL